jgi:hypothetical protein
MAFKNNPDMAGFVMTFHRRAARTSFFSFRDHGIAPNAGVRTAPGMEKTGRIWYNASLVFS